MNCKLVELQARMDSKLVGAGSSDGRAVERLGAELRAEFRTVLAAQRADLIKLSFLFWLGMVLRIYVSRAI